MRVRIARDEPDPPKTRLRVEAATGSLTRGWRAPLRLSRPMNIDRRIRRGGAAFFGTHLAIAGRGHAIVGWTRGTQAGTRAVAVTTGWAGRASREAPGLFVAVFAGLPPLGCRIEAAVAFPQVGQGKTSSRTTTSRTSTATRMRRACGGARRGRSRARARPLAPRQPAGDARSLARRRGSGGARRRGARASRVRAQRERTRRDLAAFTDDVRRFASLARVMVV